MKPRNRNNAGGFTIIELSIVLVIVGVLASLAITMYVRHTDKARMTQAKVTLKHLQKTESIYFTENGEYTDDLSLMDFDPEIFNYYRVSVVLDNAASDYTGIATGINAMRGDRWTIRSEGNPEQDNTSRFR